MDCNNCSFLSITEEQQNLLENKIPHICTKYNKRVIHYTQNKEHSSYLYPCDECKFKKIKEK